VFIVGQPRSGTTKLEELMEQNPNLVCLKTYEVLYPFLIVQKVVDFVNHLDKTYFNQALYSYWIAQNLFAVLDDKKYPERQAMHRMRYDLSEEDDAMFMICFLHSFLLFSFFPDADMVDFYSNWNRISKNERKRMMTFHHRGIQKVLYRRGEHKRYLCKWVNFTGQTDDALEMYPDAQFVIIARDPQDQIPSKIKLDSLMVHQFVRCNLFKVPKIASATKEMFKRWYNTEIQLAERLSEKQCKIILFSELYADIYANCLDICNFLGESVEHGSPLDKYFCEQSKKQATHKPAIIGEECFMSRDDIAALPDLICELTRIRFEKSSKAR